MEDKVISTRHGAQRTKERLGLSKTTAAKNAEKALRYGLTHCETRGRLHRHLDKLCLSHGSGATYRVYHRSVYVFKENRLVTVMALPNTLIKIADKQQEQKEKEVPNGPEIEH